jgi:hypothetical protein
MKAVVDLDDRIVVLGGDQPEERATLRALADTLEGRALVLALDARDAKTLTLVARSAVPRAHPWTAGVTALARTVGTRAPDWLAAAALVAFSSWVLESLSRVVPNGIVLGASLLCVVAAAALAAGASWLGVEVKATTPRVWRWAYWYAVVCLVLVGSGALVAVALWLAWVLGGLAWRVSP